MANRIKPTSWGQLKEKYSHEELDQVLTECADQLNQIPRWTDYAYLILNTEERFPEFEASFDDETLIQHADKFDRLVNMD